MPRKTKAAKQLELFEVAPKPLTKTATLSIIVPTVGRGPIENLIHSITSQGGETGDEVLVVGDGPQPEVERIIRAADTVSPIIRFKYMQGPLTHDWGHSQINYALPLASGTHILIQDDDDIYTPRAFAAIRTTLSRNFYSPHLFRFWTYGSRLVWNSDEGRRIALGHIGGHNLIIPNDKNDPDMIGVGAWSSDYYGDFSWVKHVLSQYPEKRWVWVTPIIVRQRHESRLLDRPVLTGTELEHLRTLRNECRLFMTSHQEELTQEDQIKFATILSDKANHWAYIFAERDAVDNTPVGFTYTRRSDDGRLLVTFGLAQRARGRGLGRFLLGHALDAAHEDLHSEVLATNTESYNLHRTLGFQETGRTSGPHGDIIRLVKEYPR